MTTSTTVTAIDHTSTTGFRAWGLEMKTQMAAVGLVQTADTGQINWATVNFSATGNTVSGYEVWRFVDSTVYFKLEYGTSNNGSGYPGMWITVGTGSNGSGTITGSAITTRAMFLPNSTPASSVTSYPSYWSRTADHFAFFWKSGALGSATPMGYLVIGKTVDGTGAATTTGLGIIHENGAAGAPYMTCVRLIATALVTTPSQKFVTAIGDAATSADSSGNYQVYETYVNVLDVQPFLYACGVNISDIPRGSTFSVAMVGATAHTYLAMGNTNGLNGHAAANYGLAMLYE